MKRIIATLLSLSLVLAVAPAASAWGGASRGTITDIVAASGGEFDRKRSDYDILLNAVLAAGLEGPLANPDATLTVFAPNDAAFIRTARDLGYKGRSESGAWNFLVGALTELGGGDPIPVLTNILLYHVAPGYYGPLKVIFSRKIPTLLDGAEIKPRFIFLRDNDPDLRDPRLVLRGINIKADNGVIHTINRVLIPIDI
ncbi:MAG TPA: fasciclin domain-containing protein [Candidatus Limnocylindria bacterium]